MATDSPSSQRSSSEEPSAQRRYNSRLGLILFSVYLVFYLGFVLINAFAASLMETITFAGLNLAIVYGFGLIVAALVLALVYGYMCQVEVEPSSKDVAEDAGLSADDERGGDEK